MVGISLLTLVPGELGGTETYVRELLRGFGRVGTHSYRVLLPPVAPDAAEGLPSETASEYLRAQTVPKRLAAMSMAAVRPAPLRRHLRGAYVVHYPLTLRIPPMAPSVVSLLDVQHLDLPQMFSRSELAFRKVAWHRSVRSADRVIAISEFVRGRAIEQLGLDPDRVRVVPLGVDHATLTPGDGAREPFLLYPARRWPHKNHERLFEAFALLRRDRPELRLVLTGGGDFSALPDGVEARGHLAWPEVVSLMQRASALVFPSLYEGFGMPPLEAMACGCPVACSNVASLPEVVGDAARLFDPHDPVAIEDAVNDVLDDPAPWIELGLARAQLYSWDATARATDAVYGELSTRS